MLWVWSVVQEFGRRLNTGVFMVPNLPHCFAWDTKLTFQEPNIMQFTNRKPKAEPLLVAHQSSLFFKKNNQKKKLGFVFNNLQS